MTRRGGTEPTKPAAARQPATPAADLPPGQRIRPEDIRRCGPRWSIHVGRFFSRIVWHTTVIGAEKVPRTGPLLLAANHMGIADGPVLHGAAPRGTHIVIKQEMFHGPIGWVLRNAGQIPVDRSVGRPALTTALALLEEGRAVAIFPEGARGSGDVSTAQAGIAWLAVRSGAPVVPVAILGTRKSGEDVEKAPRFRAHLYVVFGNPVQVAPRGTASGRAALAAAMSTIQTALSEHVQDAAERTGVALPTEDEAAATDAAAEVATSPEPATPAGTGHEFTIGRRIAAPPERVWTVLTSVELAASTLSGVTAVEVLTPGPYDVGTRWRETRRMFGKEETEEMWVTAAEPGARTVIEAEASGAHYVTTFTLTPAGTGTQLDMTFAARTVAPGFGQRITWALFGRLGLRATRKVMARDLADIALEANRKG